jgi:hypothetical protein
VFLDSLATLFNNDHSFMLSGLQCLRLSRTVRDQAGGILTDGKVKVIETLSHNDPSILTQLYYRICYMQW